MIDHLTPYEGVVFGALITLGIICVAWGDDPTQYVGAVGLSAGFWGGAITLVRALLQKSANSLYAVVFILGALALLVKYIVFPSETLLDDLYLWVLLGGVTLAGLVGGLLVSVIRQPEPPPGLPVEALTAFDDNQETEPEPTDSIMNQNTMNQNTPMPPTPPTQQDGSPQ